MQLDLVFVYFVEDDYRISETLQLPRYIIFIAK